MSNKRQQKFKYAVTQNNYRAAVSALEFALEYLEANEGEYGTEDRIAAAKQAISQSPAIFTNIGDGDLSGSNCEVYIRGLGMSCEANGSPIYIEYYEGKWWCVIWGDITQDDPTHRIDLSLAAEALRPDED